MMAANRYLLSTVFFLIFLNYVFEQIQYSRNIIFLVSGVYIAVFMMLGIYKSFNGMNYLETIIYFGKFILWQLCFVKIAL